MYTLFINGKDFGTSAYVKALKIRCVNYEHCFTSPIWAEIKTGNKIYATYDGKTWERYVSCNELRNRAKQKQVKACKQDILSSPWTIEAHNVLREKYGEEIFTKAFA